jgi:hypothetical protein
MFYANPTTPWILGREDPAEERDRVHRIALHEARIATAYRQAVAATRRPAATGGAGPAPANRSWEANVAACCA